MTRIAEPQTDRLTTAALDALGMSQIIKPGRPLPVAGNDETRRRSCGQPLEHLHLDLRGAPGAAGSPKTPSMILAQAPSAPATPTACQSLADGHILRLALSVALAATGILECLFLRSMGKVGGTWGPPEQAFATGCE
jgi:hypothetical protein